MAAAPRAGAHHADSAMPTPIVTSGVTSISTFVSFDMALPTSEAMIATNKTASGPPAPPSAFDAKPTVISEKRTSGGQWSAYPIATAIAGPLIAVARPPTVYSAPATVATVRVRKLMPNCVPSVLMIVPMRSEQKSPCAIAPSASMP